MKTKSDTNLFRIIDVLFRRRWLGEYVFLLFVFDHHYTNQSVGFWNVISHSSIDGTVMVKLDFSLSTKRVIVLHNCSRCLFDTKPPLEPVLTYCQLNSQEQTSVKLAFRQRNLAIIDCNMETILPLQRFVSLYPTTFSCWLVLLFYIQIVLVLVCCRKSNNVHCFGAIFLNKKICIYILLRRQSGPCATQRIKQLPNYQTPWVSLGWSRWGASNTSTVTVNTRNIYNI